MRNVIIIYMEHFNVEPTVLIDDEFCKLAIVVRDSEYATISFSSTPPYSNPVPNYQWVAVTEYATAIFVIDKTNSWGNHLDWNKIVSMISPYIANAKEVHAIGFCMGGTNSIIASNFIKIDRVVAFTPQYSVHPDILTGRSYLDQFRNYITKWPYKSLENMFNDETEYILVLADNPDDNIQNVFFEDKSNITKYNLGEDSGHDGPNLLGNKMGDTVYNLMMGNNKPLVEFIINEAI